MPRPATEAEYPGSVVVTLPTLVIFFVLQKQFVAGLTLGATKG